MKPQVPGDWPQLPALWVWLMRLTKVASSHSCWIYEAVLFAAILSSRGTHIKSVLGIQLVKVVLFFFYPVGLEIRKKPVRLLS